MQKKTTQILLLILAVGWIIVIFMFSAKTAPESMKQSDGIVDYLIRVLVPDYDSLPTEQQTDISDTMTTIVRKGAHMAEYAILTVILYALISKWNLLERRLLRVVCAWSGAVLFAVSDELHQLFVPGRSGELTDILIDGSGALIGVLLAAGIAYLSDRRRSRKKCLEV
ncbi:MAG: VanZ family protein [Clostridia bacterium]|nr:VanZ family protein [Clostridia bacterium]